MSAAHVGTLLEEHLLEESLDPGADFDELLSADTADVFAVDFDVVRAYGFDLDDGKDRFRGFGAEEPPESSGDQDDTDGQDSPRSFGEVADVFSGLFAELERMTSCAGRLLNDFLA